MVCKTCLVKSGGRLCKLVYLEGYEGNACCLHCVGLAIIRDLVEQFNSESGGYINAFVLRLYHKLSLSVLRASSNLSLQESKQINAIRVYSSDLI